MKRLLILVALFGALGLSFHPQPAQSADATSAWNSVAAQYNFNTSASAMMGSTFAQNYRGTDFNTDFGAILAHVAGLMGTHSPPFGEGDVMSTSLSNWPDD
jgi:hypothetical protein